jgi:hypothetical protein
VSEQEERESYFNCHRLMNSNGLCGNLSVKSLPIAEIGNIIVPLLPQTSTPLCSFPRYRS